MRTAFTLMLLIFAAGAWSQGQFKYIQEWTPPVGSRESRVFSCTAPRPVKQALFDDWRVTQSGFIDGVDFWGTLRRPNDTNLLFYIAIYETDPADPCRPGSLRCSYCVRAEFIPVGVDCEGRTVYHFFAPFPAGDPPCPQREGEHLWLEVAEINPNRSNFRWSGHQPREFCRALRLVVTSVGLVFKPVTDPCPDPTGRHPKMDLAFSIHFRPQ